jgi:aspartyl-tRNA(Asn)/glutamyl-tRNA(Gln) amidotransferase subunit A
MTIGKLSEALAKGNTTSEQLLEQCLQSAQDRSSLNIFLTMDSEGALRAARESDARRAAGKPSRPLEGIPVAIKDNLCTEGVRTTCASRILKDFVPPYTATAVKRLQDAGAIVIGKTNLDEFAMGSSCEKSAFGPTRNPRVPDRVPGGSSGGSAAAVAAGIVPISLGSDTGGSIRQPASFCGVVGLKPTYGRISRYGLVAYASSLDQVGPFANSVEDAALLLELMAGTDPCDNTSSAVEVPSYRQEMMRGVKGMRIGIPKEYWGEGLEPGVRSALEASVECLKAQGAEVVDVSLPSTKYAISAYYIIATAEASSNLSRFDGVRYTARSEEAKDIVDLYGRTRSEFFGHEVWKRILVGTFVLSSGYYDAYYSKAQRVRRLIAQEFSKAFEVCDVLATPVAPTPPWKLGEKMSDPMAMYLSDIDTVAVNMAGLPGLVVPSGNSDGLPVGIQFIGRAFGEGELFRVGKALEAGD